MGGEFIELFGVQVSGGPTSSAEPGIGGLEMLTVDHLGDRVGADVHDHAVAHPGLVDRFGLDLGGLRRDETLDDEDPICAEQ